MFKLLKREVPSTEPYITLLGTDEVAFSRGQAVKLVSGKVAVASATDKPTHIVVADVEASVSGVYPEVRAFKILPDMVFEVEASVTVAATLVGAKVTLNTGALEVTATTTNGVFTIVTTDGAKAVTGRFE